MRARNVIASLGFAAALAAGVAFAGDALEPLPANAATFTPQYPLWSDGATKRRWISLPDGTAIDGSRPAAWEFPVGTKFWKEFSASGRRVETRTIERAADGSWQFRAYVWSDMFDPHHNAIKGPYYLVDGDLTGSWEGLNKDVVIVNWNGGKSKQSLAFFAGRGHEQVIAAYYDDPSLQSTRRWLDAANDEPSVKGIMYTTWRRDYDRLEAFAELCNGGR